MRQVSRIVAGVVPVSSVVRTRLTQRGLVMVSMLVWTVAGPRQNPPHGPEDRGLGVAGAQPGVLHGVDRAAAPGGKGEQVGVVAGLQRPDEAQAGAGEVGEVRGAVLSGVEHHRRRLPQPAGITVVGVVAREEGAVACGEFVEYTCELGDVGTVAGVGVTGDRDGAVAGHDQGEPDQA